jgi:hypothetical protein
LSDSFPIQNGLKQGDALSQLLFNFSSEYAISKVQENQVRLKLKGIHQLLTYADDVKNYEKLEYKRQSFCLWFCTGMNLGI